MAIGNPKVFLLFDDWKFSLLNAIYEDESISNYSDPIQMS